LPLVGSVSEAGAAPVIVLATRDTVEQAGIAAEAVPSDDNGRPVPDGFALKVDLEVRQAPTVLVVGDDARGALFGVGRLLREMRYGECLLEAPAELSVLTSPRYPLRGHQLGYRPRSNTYDQWDLRQFEQYIRDLVVWGLNAVELIPPQSSYDNISDKTDFQARAWEMNARLSELIGEYGLEVHAWVPVNDKVIPGTEFGQLKAWETVCPSSKDGREYILRNRHRMFSEMPYLHGLFVPAGDPGRCPCEKCAHWSKTLIGLCEDIAKVLLQYHPTAKLWISDQLLTQEEVDYLYQWVERERPAWLGGLVYGPSSVEPLPLAREHLSPRYPIRFYPDITHTVRCQYPVIDWDHAYALVEGREVSNPRPLWMKHVHNLLSPYTCGTISYSDGAHDDVNKVLWTALDWEPTRDAREVVEEYGRYFIGDKYGERFAEGIMRLEKNWEGPLAKNESVEDTLEYWQALETEAPALAGNWRFQLGLFRAILDAFVRRRLLADMEVEERAYVELRRAEEVGAEAALRNAMAVLAEGRARPVASDLRQRLEQLAVALKQSIGMKLWSKLGAEPERADVIDDLDQPLNNGPWLTAEMEKLLALDSEEEKKAGIERLLHWEDPGPGGFYDDLGNPEKQPHLVFQKPIAEDPGRLETAAQEFDRNALAGGRLSWRRYACAFRKASLLMRYEGLDKNAQYLLRVTYPGHRPGTSVRLVANERWELQPLTPMSQKLEQREYEIPREATASGVLELAWSRQGGRCPAVAEVWLIKKQ